MDKLYEAISAIWKFGEPIVIASFLCFILAIGFLLGKGVKHTHKIIHTKWKSRKAKTSELLE